MAHPSIGRGGTLTARRLLVAGLLLAAVAVVVFGVPDAGDTGGTPANESETAVLRYAVVYDENASRTHGDAVRAAADYWDRRDDTEPAVRLRRVENQSAADLVLRFTGRIRECNGRDGRFYYCDRSAGTDRTPDVRIPDVYTDESTRRVLTYVFGLYVTDDDPAAYPGVRPLEAAPPTFVDPWPTQSSVVVNLTGTASSALNWTAIVGEGIDYWQRNDDRYGTYTETFRFRPDADEADVTVAVVDGIDECGIHGTDQGDILGCSSPLNRTYLARDTEEIRLARGFTAETMRLTVKHEFGHLYGLEHGDDPQTIMAASNPISERRTDNETAT